MSETKWTPGPWSIDGVHVTGIGKRYPFGLAKVFASDEISLDARAANARLISAAPDMAEALADFLENPQFQVGVGGNPIAVEKMLDRARSALAKARGET